MPTRYLKPEIRDSATMDSLSELAEVMFYRLLVSVDDFGRIDARASYIKSTCFPTRDSFTAKKAEEMLIELDRKGAITLYEHGGRRYLQMTKWTNIPRAKESKCPQPNDTCIQVNANVLQLHTILPVTVTETETAHSNTFDEFWKAWPASDRKGGKSECLKVWKAKSLDRVIKNILSHITACKAGLIWKDPKYIEAPVVYLRAAKWDGAELPDPNKPFDMNEFLRSKNA